MVPSRSSRSARSGKAVRDSVVNAMLSGTYGPGFRVSPLRGWVRNAIAALCYQKMRPRCQRRFSRIAKRLGPHAGREHSGTIISAQADGLRSENCFLALPVIMFREYCGDGNLVPRAGIHWFRLDRGTFDTVTGERFRYELNQTIHRGSWCRN